MTVFIKKLIKIGLAITFYSYNYKKSGFGQHN